MKTNYVLIDYENVQPDSLKSLNHAHIKVRVFVGANQCRIPYELVDSMQLLGDRGRFIKVIGHGPNALDFHIAYYIGQFAASDPTALFHIISNDGGFDPLIEHLKTKKILVRRTQTIPDITLTKSLNGKSSRADQIKMIRVNLRQRKTGKPKTVETLGRTIAALFQKRLSGEEVSGLIDELAGKGFVTVAGAKVTYAAHI